MRETSTSTIDNALGVLTAQVLEDLGRETGSARGLPNAAFNSDEFLALEYERLFKRSWVFAGRASEVASKGDVKPVEAAGGALFIVRGSDDEIRVFHNVCPHRGARLVVDSQQQSSALTCPYHAWSFGLDGKLKGRPHFHGPDRHDRGNDPGRDEVCLFEVRSHTWYDWVFVNLDGNACSFDEYMAPAVSRFEGFDLSQFRYSCYDSFEFRCNWKLAAENFSDTYHVFKVHPGLDETYTQIDRSTARPDGVHMFMLNTLPEPGHLFSPVKVRDLPNLTGIPKERELTQPAAILFPNIGLVVSPGSLQFVYFEPVSADRCVMHLWFYFVGEGAEAPEHEQARQLIVDDFRTINIEDEGICRRLQQGRQCDAYDGGRLAPYWDAGTAHYHRQIADAILGRGAFAQACPARGSAGAVIN